MEKTTLQLIIDTQETFQRRFGFSHAMSDKERSEHIHTHAAFAVEEVYEMLRELPFHKPWKDYSDLTPEQLEEKWNLAREEWIDFLHFVANIALFLGLDEQLIRKMYLEKNQINIQRQEDPTLGYVQKGA